MPLPFFTDNCVADDVGDLILARGHSLVRLRHQMLADSADEVVAAACVAGERILVTGDGDFKAIAKRLNVTKRTYREQFHKVRLCCDETIAAKRLGDAMSIIEHEWFLVVAGRDAPLSIDITNVHIRINRWPDYPAS